jgi:hypothetical protein
MHPGRVLWAGAAGLLCLLLASNALAQSVLLLQPPPDDDVLSEAFNRLRAELALQGFEAKTLDLHAHAPSPQALAQLAKRHGAFAGIALTRGVGAPAADVCIADRVTGKILLRTLALGKEPDAPSVIAVRAAELLRSSLREYAEAEGPPPEVVGADRAAASQQVERWARTPPATAQFRVDLRAALFGVAQGIGLGYAPSLALSYRAFEGVGVGALFAGPALGASYQTGNGSAAVRQELGLARVEFVAFESHRLHLRPTLAAGIYHLDARGQVAPPLGGQSDQVTSFAAGLGFDADLRLGQRLLLGAELSALLLTPRPAVAMLKEQYTFSWPFALVSVGLGIEL